MKTLFLSTLLLLFVFGLNAQKIYVGTKLFGGVTRLPNKEVHSTSKMPLSLGYSVGAFCGITFTERLKLQGELLFTAINQKYEGTSFSTMTSTNLSAFDYKSIAKVKNIDIPVMAVLGKWLYLEGGVCFNILLKADLIENSSNQSTSNITITSKDNITDNFSRINFSLAGGGGISMMVLDHFGFNAGLRGYLGVNDFGSSANTLKETLKGSRTGYWSLMFNAGARYKF